MLMIRLENMNLRFLSRFKRITINYCYKSDNLSDQKLRIIDDNKRYVRIYHIVDVHNNSRNGQYPEYMMKVQSKQGLLPFSEC